MKNKPNVAVLSVFGVASSVTYISPSAEATIVDLTINPSSFDFQTITSVATNVLVDDNGNSVFSFQQWNDVIGKTLYAVNGASVGLVAYSQSISGGSTFGGATAIGITASNANTSYLGFNAGGNAGWLKINWGGAGGTVEYLDGAYEDAGGVIHVGTGAAADPIPEPGTLSLAALGLLAAGAARKRRKARQLAS